MYRVHDGIGMPAQVPVGGYMRTCRSYFLCLADALAEWRFLSESLSRGSFDDLKIESVDGPVRAEWWNRLWLPIAADSGGNYHCVDLDPAPGGVVGQVIQFWHDARERTVSAPDLATFLLNHVEEHEWAAVFRVKFAKN